LTWSHTNSSSATSSRESGEGDAYSFIASSNVWIYRRLASVRERPFCCFQASLISFSSCGDVACASVYYHFSRARCASSPLPSARSMIPSTSPSAYDIRAYFTRGAELRVRTHGLLVEAIEL
jgi:hypothetical protein